jgi:hypothetical protein
MSKNGLLSKDGGTVLGEMLTANTVLKELDVSSSGDGMPYGTSDGPGFAKELAVGIKDNGAILSVNLLKNSIGVEQARALVIILKELSALKSLCGNNGDERELDMSGKMKGAEDAIMLAAEIVDNGAMTSLNLSSNNIGEVDQGQAQKDMEVLLQSFGTGIEALQEHFEQPEDDSTAASVSMVSTQRVEHLLSPATLPLTTQLLQTDCCCP